MDVREDCRLDRGSGLISDRRIARSRNEKSGGRFGGMIGCFASLVRRGSVTWLLPLAGKRRNRGQRIP